MGEPVKRDLCESAKLGRVCIDDLCRGGDVTLCGFDKEAYEEMCREFSDEDDYVEHDNDELCSRERQG